MSHLINFSGEPFNLLNEPEKELIKKHLELQFFKKNEVIIKKGTLLDKIIIIYKGNIVKADNLPDEGDIVQEKHIISYYLKDDIIGFRMIDKPAIANFVALEESLCFTLEAEIFRVILNANPTFKEYLFQDNNTDSDNTPKSTIEGYQAVTKLSEFVLKKPTYVDGHIKVKEAAEQLVTLKVNSLLVKIDNNTTGLVTKTDLLNFFVCGENLEESIGNICHKNLLCIDQQSMLFNALILMTKNNVERLIVTSENDIVGILEVKELLYAFSNMYYSLGVKINDADNIDELLNIARDFRPLINTLTRKGIRVTEIQEMITEITTKLLRKIVVLTLPAELHEKYCFFVMGSEGREEQILKTDQDNALVVQDGFLSENLKAKCQEITDILLKVGYPKCTGNIMVSNSEWCLTISQWKEKIKKWTTDESMQSAMETAIFIDSKPIAGNSDLLYEIENFYLSVCTSNPLYFKFFAQAAVQFESPLTFWGGLKQHHEGIDIKKGGIFPIVHGIRTMAVQHEVTKKNTIRRIQHLMNKKILPQQLGRDLEEALSVLIRIRLKERLDRLKENTEDSTPDLIKIDQLSRIERDMLRDALAITKDFKLFLQDHYQILF